MSTRTIHWTEDTKTMKIRTDIPNFFIEFGNQMVYRIKNATGNDLSIGTVVFFNGSDNFPTVSIADYTSYLTSEGTLGVCAHTIPNNTEGYVVTSGIIRNLDLTNFSDGNEIYLYSNGNFIATKPIAPLPEVYLGTVIKSGINGILSLNVELGFELGELHNVKIEDPLDNQVLGYNESLEVWEAKDLQGLVGNMDTIQDGTTYVKTENNFTSEEKSILSNISGVNTGDSAINTRYEQAKNGSFGITIDGGGSVITPGLKNYLSLPYNGYITGWVIVGDQPGSVSVDIWKDSYGNFPPTAADSITGGNYPSLSSQQINQNTTLSGWTTNFSVGDIVTFNVLSASIVTKINLIINVIKT